MTTRRKLSTFDAKDYIIPLNTPFELGWAYSTTSPSISTFHSGNFGDKTVTLHDDGSLALAPAGSVNLSAWLFTAVATLSIALF